MPRPYRRNPCRRRRPFRRVSSVTLEHDAFRSNRSERQGYAQAFESGAISGRSDVAITSESAPGHDSNERGRCTGEEPCGGPRPSIDHRRAGLKGRTGTGARGILARGALPPREGKRRPREGAGPVGRRRRPGRQPASTGSCPAGSEWRDRDRTDRRPSRRVSIRRTSVPVEQARQSNGRVSRTPARS